MKAIGKDFVREVKNTRSRFISILILVALAVAFLSGLRATAPDMKLTLDGYLDRQNFMDVQVLSTLGITEDDVVYLQGLDSVAECEGAYLIDAIAAGPDSDMVAKVWTVPESINKPVIREGRMPETADECAIERNIIDKLGLGIGDRISVVPGGDYEDCLFNSEFTIVGVVSSPYYVSVERGTSSIGTGTCGAYMFMAPCAFDMDYYTAAFLTLNGAKDLDAFFDEYEDFVDAAIDDLEPLGDIRAQLRYDDIIDEANEKLDDAQKELDDAKADAENELGDAEKELADARKELDDGWQEYNDGLADLEDAKVELADAEKELADAKKKIKDGEKELADAEVKYNDGLAKYQDGVKEYEDGLAEYNDGLAKYQDGLADYEDGKQQLEDAKTELADGRKTLEDERAKAQAELDDALTKLQDGEDEYAKGYAEYMDGLKEYNAGRDQLEKNKALLAAGKAELDAHFAELDQKEAEFNAGLDSAASMASMMAGYTITPEQLLAGMRMGMFPDTYGFVAAKDELDAGRAALNAALDDYNANAALLTAAEAQLNDAHGQLYDAKVQLEDARKELDDGWTEYNDGLAKFNQEMADAEKKLDDGEAEIIKNEQTLADAWTELEDARVQLEDAAKELADGKKELEDAKTELDDGARQIEDAKKELQDGRREIRDGENEIRDGWTEVADGEVELADAYQELMDGEADYAEGFMEYLDGKAEADEKISDAEKELADARRKLADIEDCEWYVLGFGQDADRMGNLANVFPVLFFLVAALVCLTTMTRMVEEQRTQIGCLKALGYNRFRISMKYIAYGALPALVGGIAGLFIGYTLFPKMIFTAYQIMYDVPNLNLRQYTTTSVCSVAAAVATTVLATLWACLSTLREVPAELMRPKAPKPGKRVILEYIKPLWKRMSFFGKVTTRNLFRYQKRFWMTVIGIGGCTALIIAGFGLRTSLLDTMRHQYDEIYSYHAQITVAGNILPEERAAFEEYVAGNEDILKTVNSRVVASTGESDTYSIMTIIEAIEPEDLAEFVVTADFKTGEILTLDDSGVIIDQKLSELLGVGVGDEFTLDNNGFHQVRVSGICEHYLAHYAYMTPEYYEKTFGEEYKVNTYFMRLTSNDSALCDSIFSDMMALGGVSAATRIEDTRDTYQHSMERIDFVVVIVILSAAALAMVVLYNLSNINITERKRELATIKVLGFYDLEVSQYVYRENIVLTIVGIALGIGFGRILHAWLVKSVEIDLMMFGRDTDPKAYLWAALLTVLFSFLVNVLAHRKMMKIDMVESLKSAE